MKGPHQTFEGESGEGAEQRLSRVKNVNQNSPTLRVDVGFFAMTVSRGIMSVPMAFLPVLIACLTKGCLAEYADLPCNSLTASAPVRYDPQLVNRSYMLNDLAGS